MLKNDCFLFRNKQSATYVRAEEDTVFIISINQELQQRKSKAEAQSFYR